MNKYENATILSVLAHPDDETFGMGGTLAFYAQNGANVHLVCATRGEVGEMPPEMMLGHSTIAEIRESELCCAAGMLKLKGVHFLDYRDSGMTGSIENQHPNALVSQPVEEVAAKVVSFIRSLRPQVVLTFDPIGGYRHPDHIAIHNATVLAFKLAGDADYIDPDKLPPFQPERLFFHTISREFIKIAILMIRIAGKDPSKFGKNKDIDLLSLATDSYPVHARINYTSVAKLRDQASACHASQGGKQLTGGFQGLLQKIFQKYETFMQAYPDNIPEKPINDLFEGVRYNN